MAMPIIFNKIITNAINTNSMVTVGENSQPGWLSHQKRNQNLGTPSGINVNIVMISNIIDCDLIDLPVFSPSTIASPQNQML